MNVNPTRRWLGEHGSVLLGILPRPLHEHVPAAHPESAVVRAHRRRVVAAAGVVGGALLGASMSSRPGSKRFYWLTMGVAATWATGALGSGPLHLGWIQSRDDNLRRPVITPVATGVGAFGLFYCAALVARRIPVLNRAIGGVLRFADQGSTPLVVLTACANGVAEELFFRGALFAAAGERHPVVTSTVAYTAVTAATGNPALTLAGAAMGVLFALQRRASGGIQAPALTHLTWSLMMLRHLPPLFRAAISEGPGDDRP